MSTTDAPTEQTQDTGTPAEVENLLSGTREKLQSQLDELRPAHEQFIRVQTILANFDAISSGTPVRGSRGPAANGDRASRGERPEQFLAFVAEAGEKGITVAEAAQKMGMDNPNYLYRLARELTDAGKLTKTDDKRYVIVQS